MAATERRLGLYIVNGKANYCVVVVVVLGALPRAAQGLLLALKLLVVFRVPYTMVGIKSIQFYAKQ